MILLCCNFLCTFTLCVSPGGHWTSSTSFLQAPARWLDIQQVRFCKTPPWPQESSQSAKKRKAMCTSGVCPSGRCFNPRRLLLQSCPAVLALKRITAQKDVTDKTHQMDLKRWIFQLLASRYCKTIAYIARFCFYRHSIFKQSPKSALCIVTWENVV